MDLYVILSNGNKTELERFSEEKWEETKTRINKDRIVYVTPILNDETLKSYNFTEIIWGRLFNPIAKNYKKIFVTLTNNFDEMQNEFENEQYKFEKQYEEILEKNEEIKRNKNLINILKNRKEIETLSNKVIPLETEENEALRLWKESDFLTPPPDRIVQIKQTYKMSWSRFKEHINTLFC